MSSPLLDAPAARSNQRVNVADRLSAVAARLPDGIAVARAGGPAVAGRNGYSVCTFGELDADATALARGLIDLGARPGMRLALLVRPGVEFVKLVFALLRSGAVAVLADPGMGRRRLIDCLAAAELDGFIAVSSAQAARALTRRRFPRAKLNVTVGRRWFWGGVAYKRLLADGRQSATPLPGTRGGDPAAVLFTSGSTGPPKGVLYDHRMFDVQADEIKRTYQISPGGADLACFALFGLFNSAMGVTTVFPEMDFSRPAAADPRKLLAAASDWQASQAFASPAVWDRLSRYGEATGERLPTLRKIFSCGAPVPAAVLRRTLAMAHAEAEMHTPYGATEALPVATIDAREVLNETASQTDAGAGVCVGRPFDSIQWKIIRIVDELIVAIEEAEELPAGEIGELIVRGPQVSPEYAVELRVASCELREGNGVYDLHLTLHHSKLAKILDGDSFWHRMGDVGYLDRQGRFWYCGRKSQRVVTADGTLFTECCEAAFNAHPEVRRTALVGVGQRGRQTPAIVYEPLREDAAEESLAAQLRAIAEQRELTRPIRHFLSYRPFPVDVRHNSKINREQLAAWVAKRLGGE